MNKLLKRIFVLAWALTLTLALAAPAFAAGAPAESADPMPVTSVQPVGLEDEAAQEEDGGVGMKAIAAGIAVGIAAAGGAVAMGLATAKSAESIARQPEAEGKVRTTMMLGLVFIETAIIYALLVVILIIFVL